MLVSAPDASDRGEFVSTRFPRSARLTDAEQYGRVFAAGQRRGDRYFTVLSAANDVGQPRLGLAVSRRNLPRALDRNRVKRLIRESFRQQRWNLAARDIVVLVKPAARSAANDELTDALARHWQAFRSA